MSDRTSCGILTYRGQAVLAANQLFTATLRVQTLRPIEIGGRIVLAVRHVSDLGDPQMDDPRAENYISITSNHPSLQWALGPANEWGRHPWNRGIDLRLVSGHLDKGDWIQVTLGDTGQGCPGYRCQSFAESSFRFRLGIDPRGDGQWEVLPEGEGPGIRIIGNRSTALRLFIPQMTAQEERLRCQLKPEDVHGNVASEVPERVTILTEEGRPLTRLYLNPGAPTSFQVEVPRAQAMRRLVAATDNGAFYACSNPFGPSPLPGYQLYWGEIHSQSALCDGTNAPAELYAYARDAAGLDFASVTSHDFELTAAEWGMIRQATREAHVPGQFVTFLGYEWSGVTEQGGDNNIYFLDDDGPLVYSAPWPGYGPWEPGEGEVRDARSLRETIAQLADHRIMVVPHGGGRFANLDYYDARVMPLLEIHSCHRTYEYLARDAIARGMRFGFIGGSDDHRGALGDSHPAARERFFSSHSGLVAAYARALTRESLWEAFFARRVYATNGPRIVLSVTVNGVPMGGELSVPAGSQLEMAVEAHLDGMLDNIDLYRGTEWLRSLCGGEQGNQVRSVVRQVQLQQGLGTDAYWVRVRQTDGGEAWSSPVWVTGSEV